MTHSGSSLLQDDLSKHRAIRHSQNSTHQNYEGTSHLRTVCTRACVSTQFCLVVDRTSAVSPVGPPHMSSTRDQSKGRARRWPSARWRAEDIAEWVPYVLVADRRRAPLSNPGSYFTQANAAIALARRWGVPDDVQFETYMFRTRHSSAGAGGNPCFEGTFF